jgi:multiple sugar transport system ATP-binding protein
MRSARFVAGFIGSPAMNLREARLTETGVALNGYEIPITRDVRAASGSSGTILLGFRPESVEVVGPDEDGLDASVNLVEELGSDAYLFAELPHRDNVVHGADLVAKLDARRIPERGQKVRLRVRPDEVHVFSAQTGHRLN